MSQQKPIRTFTVKDENGNTYTINEYPGFTNLKVEKDNIDHTYKSDNIYRTSDGQDVIRVDENSFEIINAPFNIKITVV